MLESSSLGGKRVGAAVSPSKSGAIFRLEKSKYLYLVKNQDC